MTIYDLFNSRPVVATLLAAIVAFPQSAYSLCYGDRHPSLKDEIASSRFVVIGSLKKSSNISSPDDPEGIEATLYEMEVRQVFKGSPPAAITVRSENTSSRFVILPKQEYLLFMSGEVDAAFVDACGNSGLANERESAINELIRITEK